MVWKGETFEENKRGSFGICHENKKDVSVTIIENEDVVLDWNGDQKHHLQVR